MNWLWQTDVCERTESEPGVHEEISMGLVQAERAHNECACAIKKRASFQRRSQNSGNLVVSSVRRDCADGVWHLRAGARLPDAP